MAFKNAEGKYFGRVTSTNVVEFKDWSDNEGSGANTKYFGHVAQNDTVGNFSGTGQKPFYGLLYQSSKFIYVSKADNTQNASVLFFKEVAQECAHEWANATCTAPKTCTLCSATQGEALGHTYGDPSYEGDGKISYVATRVCSCGDTLIATANIDVQTTNATCIAEGQTVYTATFTESLNYPTFALDALSL